MAERKTCANPGCEKKFKKLNQNGQKKKKRIKI